MLLALAILSVIAAIELVSDFVQRTGVPSEAEWIALADYVRGEWRDRDVIIANDTWAEPLVRQYLGDHISLRMAGRSDLLGYARAWRISVGEPANDPGDKVVESRDFGPLSLRLTELKDEATLVADLVDAFPSAQVFAAERGPLCNRQNARPSEGGLGRGPMRPAQFWICPGDREWIGRTIIEDLDYQPRRCVWQRASTRNPSRVTFPAVGPAERLIVHGGHYLRDERKLESPPVTLNVYVAGKLAGQMTHRDGDGWKKFEVALDPQRAVTVSIEPVASGRNQNFCWSAKALK